uniref:Uncharacterized protein n=1 Tax=Castor canadensis TaxID=51338 RepID=A0A8C0ZT57_CASCN
MDTILIVDQHLLQLPLEGLSVLKLGAVSVSREFSLQMLWNRLQKEELRYTGFKSARRGKDRHKCSLWGQPLLPDDKSVVCSPPILSTEMLSPISVTQNILEKFHDSFTAHWVGHLGSQNFPSQADWEQVLGSCTGFFFYGMESFLSHISVERLAAMNLQMCQMVVVLDMTSSYHSRRRKTETSESKSMVQQSLERPLKTAILLSLVGVKSIVANQWPTVLQDNALRANILWEISPEFTNSCFMLCSTDEVPPPLRDERMPLQLEFQNQEPHPTALSLVLYGLPHQAIV